LAGTATSTVAVVGLVTRTFAHQDAAGKETCVRILQEVGAGGRQIDLALAYNRRPSCGTETGTTLVETQADAVQCRVIGTDIEGIRIRTANSPPVTNVMVR